MEKFPLNSEEETVSPLKKEKPEKSGKISRFINTAIIAGGVALGGAAHEADAQSLKKEASTSQKESVGVTAKTAWAKEMVGEAKKEASQLQNAEDLRMWTVSHTSPFIGEFYMPTKGPLVEGTYGKSRRLSPDEARFLVTQVKELIKIYTELHKKFNQPTIENITSQFQGMEASLLEDTSYARQKEREILENWEKKQGR